MKIFYKNFLFIFVGLLVLGAQKKPVFSAKEPFLASHEKAELRKIEDKLKTAIKNMDFSGVHTDFPVLDKPLFWKYCGRERESLSLGEMIRRLKTNSEESKIILNEKTVSMLSEPWVETRGWKDEDSFHYFEFNFMFTRLYGVYECEKRDGDFVIEQGEEFHPKVGSSGNPEAVEFLKTAIRTGNFTGLRKYVPSGKVYLWGVCGHTDITPFEFTFKSINEGLKKIGKGQSIQLSEEPVIKEIREGKIFAVLNSSGWKGDYPYISFTFELLQSENKWAWTGVYDCQFSSEKQRELFEK